MSHMSKDQEWDSLLSEALNDPSEDPEAYAKYRSRANTLLHGYSKPPSFSSNMMNSLSFPSGKSFFPSKRLNSHENTLVNPKVQMRNAGVGDVQSFGPAILMETLKVKNRSLNESLFSKSFLSRDSSDSCSLNTKKQLVQHGVEGGYIFPPLLLRSNVNFVQPLGESLFLVYHTNGPIVPVVTNKSVINEPSFKGKMKEIYSRHSKDFADPQSNLFDFTK